MAEYEKSMPVMPDEPLNSEEKSQLIGTTATSVKFSQDIIGLEIANNSLDANIFLDISGTSISLNNGIPIYPKNYYSADRKILKNIGIFIISDKPNTDVRIMGHFNLQSENQ